MAVGMAIAERHLNAEFGDELVDHRTWVIAGDGCLMEGDQPRGGRASPAICARPADRPLGRQPDHHRRLDRPLDLRGRRRRATRPMAGTVVRCDGHDVADIRRAHRRGARRSAPVADRLPHDHRLGRAQQAGHRRHPRRRARRRRSRRRARRRWAGIIRRSSCPTTIVAAWRAAGRRGRAAARASGGSASRRATQAPSSAAAWPGALPGGFSLDDHVAGLIANPQKVATRKASELALEAINAQLPETIGGSADLTGSNNTKTKARSR